MPSTVAMPDGIYYKVNHPEFKKDMAYRALFFTAYAESGWDFLTFINDRGMTYSVKNWRCFCLNGQPGIDPIRPPGHCTAFWYGLSPREINLPFPRLVCKNPDLEDE